MKDNGFVLSAQKNLAEVEVQCFAACQDCSAQSLCLGQSQSTGHISAKNPLHAQAGDKVSLNIPDTMYNKSLILVFGTLLSAAILGIALGHFTDCDDERYPDWTVERLFDEVFDALGIPVVSDLPFGHGRENRPWPFAGRAALDGARGELEILESAVSTR